MFTDSGERCEFYFVVHTATELQANFSASV